MFRTIGGYERGVFYISSIKKDPDNNTLIFYLMNGGSIKEQYGSVDEMNNTYQSYMDIGLFVPIYDRIFNTLHFSTVGKVDIDNRYQVHIVIRTGETIIGDFNTAAERDKFYETVMDTSFGGGLVQEDTFNDFPEKGKDNVVYLAKDTGQTYYWDKATQTYVKTGTIGRTGVYSTTAKLPETIGASTTIKKSDLAEILKPSVPYSEGSEVIGDNSVHGIIVSSTATTVEVKTITDLTIDSFRQVEKATDLPKVGGTNILYYVQEDDEFRIWDVKKNAWEEPFHPIMFNDEKVADAKLNTFYVVGDKIKYTTDNVNWIEIDCQHPLKFVDIPVAKAKIGTIYIVGDKARYTTDNTNWTYLDSEHPLEFADPAVAKAKTNVLYIDNGKAKYTTDNVNWTYLNTDHPIIFGDSPVTTAKLNTLYVAGNIIKYTTDNVNWVEISGGAAMKEYLSNVDLVTVPLGVTTLNVTDTNIASINDVELEQLVYDNKGTVGRVIKIDTTTGELKVETMTIAGDVGKKWMPIAPDTKHLVIKQRGAGYSVGDIIESTTPGTFAAVDTVDATGAILTIKNTPNTTPSTTGTGAVIDYDQILYAGYGSNWATLGDIDTLAAQIVGENFEYEQGYDYEITNAGSGYTTGDIVETTEAGKFVKVTSVGASGEILTVEFTRETNQSTTGTGVTITATANPNIFIIPTFYWNSGMGVFSLTNDDGAYVEFFRTGDDSIKYSAAADSKIYKFTFDEVNGTVTQEFYKIKGGSGDANLVENITSNTTCGAAPANTFFPKGMSFTEFAKTILIKEIAPSINVTATNSGVYAINTQIGGTTISLKMNSLGTSTPTLIEFYIDGALIDTQAYVAGKMIYSTDYSTVITSSTPKTVTATAKLTYKKSDGSLTDIAGNKTIMFVYPSFSGVTSLDSTTITDADIKAMTKLALTSKFYTASGITISNQRTVFAYPQNYGNLTSIKDANNFEYLQSYDKAAITIDGTPYNVYVLHDPVTVTNFKQVYN